MALGGTDAVIILRKRVFKHITDIPNDPVEYRLLYAEAVQQVISVSHRDCHHHLMKQYTVSPHLIIAPHNVTTT